jgi:hypothetical protein
MSREPTSSQESLQRFFDRQQSSHRYRELKQRTAPLDREAAARLNAAVSGRVLAVGGVWDHFEWGPQLESLTVLDLSEQMLSAYTPDGALAVVGDLYEHDFPAASFDAVVFPLMLHHVAEGSWRSCRHRVERAVERAAGWVAPGGRLHVLEYCPHPAWNPLQIALLPLTRRLLGAFGQPLVVMHTRAFYERLLGREVGACQTLRIAPAGFDWWSWYPVFMSIRWLRLPFALYPKLHLFSAVKPA